MNVEDNREETIVKRARQIASPEERAAFLDRTCGEDQELRQRKTEISISLFRAILQEGRIVL